MTAQPSLAFPLMSLSEVSSLLALSSANTSRSLPSGKPSSSFRRPPVADINQVSRDVQSDLHDLADSIGEKVAREEMLTLRFEKRNDNEPSLCTCKRFSQRWHNSDGGDDVKYTYEVDPSCAYEHLQPLPSDFVIHVP